MKTETNKKMEEKLKSDTTKIDEWVSSVLRKTSEPGAKQGEELRNLLEVIEGTRIESSTMDTLVTEMKEKFDLMLVEIADAKAIEQLEVQERLRKKIMAATITVKDETTESKSKESTQHTFTELPTDMSKKIEAITKYQNTTLTELKTENGRLASHIETLMEDSAVASLKLQFGEKWEMTIRTRNGLLMFWMVM